MTRRRDDIDPSEPPAVSPIPDAAEMEATDRYLDRLAAGATPAPSDSGGRLLRDAAAPGEEPELTGSAAFAAALADAVEQRRTATAEPRTFTVMGRVIAAKVVAIIAIATLGLAGAGAATGAVLHAADRRSPATTTVEVVPDSETPEAPGRGADADTSGRRDDSGELSLAEATERLATCDAASSEQGADRLMEAASATDTTPADYCAEAVAAIESAAIESAATGSGADDTTDTEGADERGAGASNGTDPVGNADEHRADAATDHTPTTGRSGAGSDGASNAGGNSANAGGANAGGANAGGANAGGTNAGTPNANAGGANANPGAPNANANAAAAGRSTTSGGSAGVAVGRATPGARSPTGQGAASSPGRAGVIPWGVCAAECSAPRVTDPPMPAAASTSNRSSATSAPRTVVSANGPRSHP